MKYDKVVILHFVELNKVIEIITLILLIINNKVIVDEDDKRTIT